MLWQSSSVYVDGCLILPLLQGIHATVTILLQATGKDYASVV